MPNLVYIITIPIKELNPKATSNIHQAISYQDDQGNWLTKYEPYQQ